MNRFTVVRLYDPIASAFKQPKVMTYAQAIQLQKERKIIRVYRFCDTKEEAIRAYWNEVTDTGL